MPIPSFGNGQELALLLEEYWADHPELQSVPIYFASGLFARGMRVYKTYVHTMNANIRARFARRDNPFDFKYVKWLKEPRRLDEHKGPCVVMASAQFMSFGLSRELLEDWAADAKNGVIVTGYSIEGTMARVGFGVIELTTDIAQRARTHRITARRDDTSSFDREGDFVRRARRLCAEFKVHPGDWCSARRPGPRRGVADGSIAGCSA